MQQRQPASSCRFNVHLKPPGCEMIGQTAQTIDHYAAAAFQPR
jgi:hypothetical protein